MGSIQGPCIMTGLTNILSSFEYSLGHLACHLKIRPGQPGKEEENSLKKKIDLNTEVKPLTEHIELKDLFGFEIDIFETMETDGEVRINIQAETYFSMGALLTWFGVQPVETKKLLDTQSSPLAVG